MVKRIPVVLAAALLATLSGGALAQGQSAQPPKARNVVLVHGAWADGSS